MKKNKITLILTLIFIILSCSAKNTKAAELITNGGFETGNFAGWTVSSASGNGWYPWQVTAAGGGDGSTGVVTTSSPVFGTRSAWNGFCCNSTNNPEFIYQDVTIPAAQTATLRWAEKIQSDLQTFCTSSACGTNTYRVQILNTSNVLLQNLFTVSNSYPSRLNTGWQFHTVNISAYAGQTIRIRFATSYASTIGGNQNGPGRAEIDGVSIQSPEIVTATNATVSGRITTDGGRGISLANVTLTDLSGNARAVNTNQFGMFYFEEVEAGQTYIISVGHKKYTFPNNSRVINVGDELTDVDFTATP